MKMMVPSNNIVLRVVNALKLAVNFLYIQFIIVSADEQPLCVFEVFVHNKYEMYWQRFKSRNINKFVS